MMMNWEVIEVILEAALVGGISGGITTFVIIGIRAVLEGWK